MESTLKDRLIDAIREKGLTINGFEKITDSSKGFVNNITKGIGAEKLLKILSVFPDLNPYWLVHGEGAMWMAEGQPRQMTVELAMQLREDDRKRLEAKVDQLDNQISDLISQNKTLTEVIANQQRTTVVVLPD